MIIPVCIPRPHPGLGPVPTHGPAPTWQHPAHWALSPPPHRPSSTILHPPTSLKCTPPEDKMWTCVSLGHSAGPFSLLPATGPKAFSTRQADHRRKTQCQPPAFNSDPGSKPHFRETEPAPPPRSLRGIPPMMDGWSPGERAGPGRALRTKEESLAQRKVLCWRKRAHPQPWEVEGRLWWKRLQTQAAGCAKALR